MNKLLYKILVFFFPNKFYKPAYKWFDAEEDTDPDLCKKCGGRCCLKCGCYYSPDDFGKITFIKLKRIIDRGYIKIEYIPGKYFNSKRGTYILRIRNKGESITGHSISSKCILHSKMGCKLPLEKRPSGGKMLIPIVDYEGIARCYNRYGLDDCCHEWNAYRRIVRHLVRYYRKYGK